MKKSFLFIISGVILLFGVGLFFWTQKTESPEKKKPSQLISPTPQAQEELGLDEIPELELSPEELESYSRVYQDTFVLYLRKALDAYLANDSRDVNISMAAVQEEHGGRNY